jgi:hypothetical protein
MSDNQTVSSLSTEGGGATIVDPSTQQTTNTLVAANVAPEVDSIDNIFVLAGQLEALLKNKSNRVCLRVMNMVGSLHSIRCIPVDRPIGQPTMGTAIAVPSVSNPNRGQPTPPAAWKQTEAYRTLTAQRESLVDTIRNLSPAELVNTTHVADMREIERQLKELKSAHTGN